MKKKSRRIGPSIHILFIIIMSQTQCYGRSTLSHSNTSQCNTKNSTTQRESHDEGISNAEKVLRSLGGIIRADHNARKAAFFQKELDICLTQMERCNATMAELSDHLVSTVSTARTSDPRSQTITPTAHESSRIQIVGQGKLTTAKNGNSEELPDQNVNLTKPTTELQEKAILLRKKQAEFSKIKENFLSHDYHGWNVSPWIDLLLHTVFVRVISKCEKNLKTLYDVILREDAAEKMTAVFTKEEIVYVDFLLAEMENLNLVKRKRKSTKKSNLPLPIEELREFISPSTVRWIFSFLFDKSPWVQDLRSKVESEPNLSLFEFCWCISKINNALPTVYKKWYTEEKVNGKLGMGCVWIRQVIEEFIERKNNEYGSAEPLLRTIKVLLIACEEIEDIEILVIGKSGVPSARRGRFRADN